MDTDNYRLSIMGRAKLKELVIKIPDADEPCIDAQYDSLSEVLLDAYLQVAYGKGDERHATDEPFEQQNMIQINKIHTGHCLGQASKKITESTRLSGDAKERELLGAIAYIAGEIVTMRLEGE